MRRFTQCRQLLCAVLGIILLCCTNIALAQGNHPAEQQQNGTTLQPNPHAEDANGIQGETETPCINPLLINPFCVCPAVYDPVCGCNGVTYSNACLAQCSGVTRWEDGPCALCQGPELNIICTTQYDPVCGCDGNTYSNACFAMAAGILIFVPGECPFKRANEGAAPTTLSPNPTNGIATLRWTPTTDGNATVTVVDMVGKVVAESGPITEYADGINTYSLNTEGWESGIYMVRLSTGGQEYTMKLMVTH